MPSQTAFFLPFRLIGSYRALLQEHNYPLDLMYKESFSAVRRYIPFRQAKPKGLPQFRNLRLSQNRHLRRVF